MTRPILALALLLPACADDTACASASEGVDTESPALCCHAPTNRDEQVALCLSHPFGRAPYCDGIERPQTFDRCMTVLEANSLCTSDYVACRDAIRVAACDECPAECAGIEHACDP